MVQFSPNYKARSLNSFVHLNSNEEIKTEYQIKQMRG